MIGALYGLIFVLLCGLVAFGSLAVLLVEKNDRTERERDWYRTLAESSIRVNARECRLGESGPPSACGHFPQGGKQGQGGAGTGPVKRPYVAPVIEIILEDEKC